MKKHRKISVAICLIVSIVISGISGFHVSAALSDYSTCVAHHFDRIDGNVPSNVHDSCGYVALSLFLSFYDVYWNENLVADKYEAHNTVSSGILDPNPAPYLALEYDDLDKYINGNELTSAKYKTFIEVNKDNYFHMYLLYLASTDDKNNNFTAILNLLDADYGVTTAELKTLLEYYLFKVCNFDTRGITVHTAYSSGSILSETNKDFLQSIRDKVTGNEVGGVNNSGIPVIYRGTNPSTGYGHFLIAYDTEHEEGKEDDIILHEGKRENPVSSVYSTEYTQNVDILWIEINEEYFPHVHCSDYTWRETGEMVCSCIAYKDMHPAHVHDKTFTNNTTDTTHAFTCSRCGDHSVFTESHGPFSYLIISNTYHLATCECGYQREEQHQLYSLNARYMACRKCPYTRDNSGGIEEGVMKTEEETETE